MVNRMKNLFLGSLLAAIAVFLFGAAYWMSPPVQGGFGVPPQPAALGKSLLDQLPGSGVYVVPTAVGTPAEQDAAARQGPLAIIHYQRDGQPAMEPALLFRGFLLIWLTMALMAFLLRLTAPALPTYGRRVLLVVVTGLIVAANSDWGATVWWHHSAVFAGLSSLYNVLAFLIAGLILANFTRSR